MSLEGKVALVTGASRGIGREIALRLASDGAAVAVHYGRDAAAAGEVVGQIRERGGRAVALAANFSDADGTRALFDALDAESATLGGGLDILVNNAGISTRGAIDEATRQEVEELVEVNLVAPLFVTQQALTRMSDGGRIVNISSGVTRIAFPEELGYAMTKGAIDVFTRTLAKQLGPRGITVNAVAPGITDTDTNAAWLRGNAEVEGWVASVTALGRVGQPRDIAGVVSFLASPDAGWVTGSWIDATGGAEL